MRISKLGLTILAGSMLVACGYHPRVVVVNHSGRDVVVEISPGGSPVSSPAAAKSVTVVLNSSTVREGMTAVFRDAKTHAELSRKELKGKALTVRLSPNQMTLEYPPCAP